MKIRIIKTYAMSNKIGAYEVGRTYDLAPGLALRLINRGFAETVEPIPPRLSVQASPTNQPTQPKGIE